jgi:hypothetical protein
MKIISAIFSIGGFTKQAKVLCEKNQIGITDEITIIIMLKQSKTSFYDTCQYPITGK